MARRPAKGWPSGSRPSRTPELGELFRKFVGPAPCAPERDGRERIGARCAAEAEVDAARVERLEQAVDLGDAERRVVREHDPARAEAETLGARGDVRDQDLRRRRRDAGHVVVLGVPEPPVAEALERVGEALRVARGWRRPPSTRGRDRAGRSARQTSRLDGGAPQLRRPHRTLRGRVLSGRAVLKSFACPRPTCPIRSTRGPSASLEDGRPFPFSVHHRDAFFGQRAVRAVAGRNLGQDFENKDG